MEKFKQYSKDLVDDACECLDLYENFQVLKGVAKYTANFTPPTQTQGRTYQAES